MARLLLGNSPNRVYVRLDLKYEYMNYDTMSLYMMQTLCQKVCLVSSLILKLQVLPKLYYDIHVYL